MVSEVRVRIMAVRVQRIDMNRDAGQLGDGMQHRVPSLLADTRVIEPLPAPAVDAVADAMERPEIDAFVELHE